MKWVLLLNRKAALKGISVTALTFLLLACGSESRQSPEKPGNVPANAMWIGKPDKGVFAAIDHINGEYTGTIYAGKTGEVRFEGGFIYTGKAPFDHTDSSLYQAWNGDILFLTNGEKLITKRSGAM